MQKLTFSLKKGLSKLKVYLFKIFNFIIILLFDVT